MTKNRYQACKTLDELKREYRADALKNHPDCGGSTEAMQKINADYEVRFNELKEEQNARAAATEKPAGERVRATKESAGDFIKIVNALLKLDGITVELCGRWLWIGGDTKRHKEALKAAGCRWHQNKKLWSWHFAEDGERWKRGGATMREIRAKYGTTSFSAADEVPELA